MTEISLRRISRVWLRPLAWSGLVIAGLGGSVAGQGRYDRPRDFEIYAGALAIGNRLSRGFDGTSFLVGTDADGNNFLVEIPTIRRGLGWGMAAGVKKQVSRGFGVGAELEYTQSYHKGDWLDVPVSSKLTALDIALMAYFLPGGIQPYVRFGLCVPSLTAGRSYVVIGGAADARFGGIGAVAGAGLELSLSRRLAVRCGADFRALSFGSVGDGIDDPAQLDHSISSRSVGAELAAMFRWGQTAIRDTASSTMEGKPWSTKP